MNVGPDQFVIQGIQCSCIALFKDVELLNPVWSKSMKCMWTIIESHQSLSEFNLLSHPPHVKPSDFFKFTEN